MCSLLRTWPLGLPIPPARRRSKGCSQPQHSPRTYGIPRAPTPRRAGRLHVREGGRAPYAKILPEATGGGRSVSGPVGQAVPSKPALPWLASRILRAPVGKMGRASWLTNDSRVGPACFPRLSLSPPYPHWSRGFRPRTARTERGRPNVDRWISG